MEPRETSCFSRALFVDKVPDYLICPIGSGVINNPVRCHFCGKTFCSGCLVEWLSRNKSCPICQKDLNDESLHQPGTAVNEQINSFKISCIKCQWVGVLEDYVNVHKNVCEKKKKCIVCAEEFLKQEDLERHKNACPRVKVKCGICENNYFRFDESHHEEEECQSECVFGCNEKGPFNLDHLANHYIKKHKREMILRLKQNKGGNKNKESKEDDDEEESNNAGSNRGNRGRGSRRGGRGHHFKKDYHENREEGTNYQNRGGGYRGKGKNYVSKGNSSSSSSEKNNAKEGSVEQDIDNFDIKSQISEDQEKFNRGRGRGRGDYNRRHGNQRQRRGGGNRGDYHNKEDRYGDSNKNEAVNPSSANQFLQYIPSRQNQQENHGFQIDNNEYMSYKPSPQLIPNQVFSMPNQLPIYNPYGPQPIQQAVPYPYYEKNQQQSQAPVVYHRPDSGGGNEESWGGFGGRGGFRGGYRGKGGSGGGEHDKDIEESKGERGYRGSRRGERGSDRRGGHRGRGQY